MCLLTLEVLVGPQIHPIDFYFYSVCVIYFLKALLRSEHVLQTFLVGNKTTWRLSAKGCGRKEDRGTRK